MISSTVTIYYIYFTDHPEIRKLEILHYILCIMALWFLIRGWTAFNIKVNFKYYTMNDVNKQVAVT